MNIFKVLSEGDGRLPEPNISAFLAYILDPGNAHGIGSSFLERFMRPLVLKNNECFKKDLFWNNKVADLSTKSVFTIEVATEKIVHANASNDRHIDILLEIYKEEKIGEYERIKKRLYAICIENKIREAFSEHQLSEEIVGLNKLYEQEKDKDNIPQLCLVFITKNDSENSKEIYRKYLQEKPKGINVISEHMIWDRANDEKMLANSISCQISEVLKLEAEGGLEPIHDYTKYTLKSFLNFISSNFKTYNQERIETEKNKIGTIPWDSIGTAPISVKYSGYRDYILNFMKYEYLAQIKELVDELGLTLDGIAPAGQYFWVKMKNENIAKFIVQKARLALGVPRNIIELNKEDGFNFSEKYNYNNFYKEFYYKDEIKFSPKDLDLIRKALVKIKNALED